MPHTELTKQAKDLIYYHNFLLRGGKRYIAETQTAIALMDSGPPSALKNLMDIFIRSQVLSGNWALMDCFQFYAMDTVANAVINWIGNFSNALLVNSPTFDAFDGITGDGVNQNIDSQYNPNVDAVNTSQNDIAVFVWMVDNLDTGDLKYIFGAESPHDIWIRQRTTPRLNYRVNDATNTNHGTTMFQDETMYGVIREDSANKKIAVDATTASTAVASTGVVTTDILVLADTGTGWINAKVGALIICKATGLDLSDLHSNLSTLITDTAALG